MRFLIWSVILACSPAAEPVEEPTAETPASGSDTTTGAESPTVAVEPPESEMSLVEPPDTNATPDACPTALDGPMAACREEGRRCPLADGDCVCARHPVVQGVALPPGEVPPTNPRVWDCRPTVREDGCPGRPPSGRCRREGQECGYLAHEARAVCSRGSWVSLPPQPVP